MSRILRRFITPVILIALASPIYGEDGSLVADIRTTAGISESSQPNFGVVFNGALYFLARNDEFGSELWRTDGTPGGTELAADLCPGTCSGFPGDMAVFNGQLYFGASSPHFDREIFVSDGTAAGTRLLADIFPGDQRTFVSDLTVSGGRIFFEAQTPDLNSQLWATDGSEAGTGLVLDIFPGGDANPVNLTPFNGGIVFRATDATAGAEPWFSDGTAAGTFRLADIPSGSFGSSPQGFARVNSRVVFTAFTGSGGALWVTDGTLPGTFELRDFSSGEFPQGEVSTNDESLVFLNAGAVDNQRRLWMTDGTIAGTLEVPDSPRFPQDIAAFLNGVIFNASDLANTTGQEPYFSDGLSASLVSNIQPGSTSSGPRRFTQIGSLAYFRANAGSGQEPWVTDGTDSGTISLGDICPGTCQSFPSNFVGINGLAVFDPENDVVGVEPYVSDGTASGTDLLRDVRPPNISSVPRELTAFQRQVFFTADDGIAVRGGGGGSASRKLYSSDGSTTEPVGGGRGFSQPAFVPFGLTGFDRKLFMFGTNSNGRLDPMVSNGNNVPSVIENLCDAGSCDAVNSREAQYVASGGELFFAGQSTSGDNELWKTDGTAAGTSQVKDILAGSSGSFPVELTDAGGMLFFAASDVEPPPTRGGGSSTDNLERELWMSDGTELGTEKVAEIHPGDAGSNPVDLVALGGLVFFSADDGSSGQEMWVSDGTGAGTLMVADLNSGTAGSAPRGLTVFNGQLLFSANDGSTGRELWAYDPNTRGPAPVRLTDLCPGACSAFPVEITPAEFDSVKKAYFVARDDGTTGRELWMTDGTPGGLTLIADIQTGAGSARPSGLLFTEGFLYFSADDGVNGRESWVVNAKDDAIELSEDIAIGAAHGNPEFFTKVERWIYYAARDGSSGVELYRERNRNVIFFSTFE